MIVVTVARPSVQIINLQEAASVHITMVALGHCAVLPVSLQAPILALSYQHYPSAMELIRLPIIILNRDVDIEPIEGAIHSTLRQITEGMETWVIKRVASQIAIVGHQLVMMQ